MARISALEVQRQARRLREERANYGAACSKIAGALDHASRCVSANHKGAGIDRDSVTLPEWRGYHQDLDSSRTLYQALEGYLSTYASSTTNATRAFDKLADIMENWVNKTVGNEDALATSIMNLTSQVMDITDGLNQLHR